ncbi:MAG: hypothetical protein ACTJLM_00690 [Ehrlichia sp.]
MFVMYFDVLVYLFIALGALGICIALFVLYTSYVHEHILKMFCDCESQNELTDEEKYKEYLEKKQKELIKHQMLADDLSHVQCENDIKIVDIMNPIGHWTRLIMSEKLQRFAGLRFDKNQAGFWQVFVSMKSLSQGKHRGKSR